MRGYMNTCIHHHVLAKRSILWELEPFTITCFHFAKHISGIVSHKYLLTTLCFLCFSKLSILLMIEWGLDAFDVVSLMGVSPWEVSKRTFFKWSLLVYHDLMEAVPFQQDLSGMSCLFFPGRLLHSCTGSAQSQGRQQPAVSLYINNSPWRILKIGKPILGFLEFK